MRGEMRIQDLKYTDEMVQVSDSMDILEELLKVLDVTCSGMGLTLVLKNHIFLPSILPILHVVCPAGLKPDDEPVAVVEELSTLAASYRRTALLTDHHLD